MAGEAPATCSVEERDAIFCSFTKLHEKDPLKGSQRVGALAEYGHTPLQSFWWVVLEGRQGRDSLPCRERQRDSPAPILSSFSVRGAALSAVLSFSGLPL